MNLKKIWLKENFQIGPMPPPSLPSVSGHLAPNRQSEGQEGKIRRAASPPGGRTTRGCATQPPGPPHSLVNVHLAPGALVAQGAGAGVPLVVAVGGAGGAIVAGVGGAGVHLPLASLPVERRIAHAEEVVDPIDAGAAILAGGDGSL